MNWTENTDLAPLVISEDAKTQYTTYERLCYHLVHEHGYEDWVVVQRAQTELENIHNRCHKNMTVNHKHDKPVRICGYEPKKRKIDGDYSI